MVLNRFDRIDKKEILKFSLIRATFLKYWLVRFTINKFGSAKLRKPNHIRNFLANFSTLLTEMNLHDRIVSFEKLGALLPDLIAENQWGVLLTANPWFTRSEITRTLHSWSLLLTVDNLTRWTQQYPAISTTEPRNILVITAGNIPLVGFHDFLSVLISGNRFVGKLSSRDNLLITLVTRELIGIDPGFSDQIDLTGNHLNPDAVVATGSNNSARYFESDYGHLAHIIRKNRSSAAVLDGSESPGELDRLAADILEYYGLGCRSVSHVFLPEGFDPEKLVSHLKTWNQTDPCQPLLNNLQYQRARLSILNVSYLDAGKSLLIENDSLHSPIGVVHYSFYRDLPPLLSNLTARTNDLQCLIGHNSVHDKFIPFGSAQKPELWDYADNRDTLSFLLSLTGGESEGK